MSSVTFPTAIGGDGSTVTDDDNATTGLRNGGWRTRFIPCFTNLVNIADYIVSYTAQTSTFAEPPPMGSTTPNTGAFTRVTVTGSTAPANGLYLPAANALGFATNSTERVRIDSSGNVGIGTSSPSTKLDIAGDIKVRSGDAFFFGDTSVYTARTSNGFYWGTGSLPRMYLDSSGNLGLGVTPSGWGNSGNLQIGGSGGNIVFNSQYISVGANFYYNAGYKYIGTGPALFFESSSGGFDWKIAPSGTAGNAISFTQAMTLNASGNLLVGTTSVPTGSTGGAGFEVASNSRRILRLASTSTALGNLVEFYNPNGTVGSINTNGTATAFVTSSDQRLKENIIDAPSALSSVNAIKVRSFNWKVDGSHVDYGYIAQELLEVVPEAVSVPADPDEMMGVDFGKLTPRLVKAIQEIAARLDALEAK